MRKNPNALRSKLSQKIAPRIASFLTKHDRKWFYKNLPKPWKRTESARKIDWKIRDKECAEKVMQIAVAIKERDNKPIWIRRGSIANDFDNREWIRNDKYIKKMPLTRKAINNVTESRIDFGLRRISWAIKTIKQDSSYYSFSAIGLRAVVSWELWVIPEIKEAIESGMEEIKRYRGLF